MTVPNNKDIISFFKSYGLVLLIAIIAVIVAKAVIFRTLERVRNVSAPTCSIENLSQYGASVSLDGEKFKVRDFTQYRSLGAVSVELRKE